ncbi:MAG: hypothetical protein KQH53_16630 [Desulfarculaceae bacterium]|nr:hypothetical protein [Desulfarculaceae bacterium]
MRLRRALIALLLVMLWAGVAGAQGERPAPPPDKTAAGQAAPSVVYHGNLRSHKFHRPECRYYNCKRCTARFNSREQAIRAGYVPCKVCRP